MAFFTDDQVSRLAATEVRMAWLAQMEFKSQTERVWSGNTILEVGGYEWKPLYGAVQVDGLGWQGEPASKEISFQLSGVDTDVLSAARSGTDEADQQPITIYLLFFDEDWQVVGGLVPVFLGLMQPPKVSRSPLTGDTGGEQVVRLTAENLFYNRSRPPAGRYTSADQAKRVGWADKFFNFIPALVNRQFRWPVF